MDGKGLNFPSHQVPNFICEACTVRAVLGRELHYGPADKALLALERMRMTDVVNRWAPDTRTNRAHLYSRLQRFERHFGVSILRPTPLEAPPATPAIPLMWAQQQYALENPRSRHTNSADRVKFSTARQLRSAAAAYYYYDFQAAFPGSAIQQNGRVFLSEQCVPTDELGFTYMAEGMARRLGTDSKPPLALLHKHIVYIDRHLNRLYESATDPAVKHELALAGAANLLFWTAWLRSAEGFHLTRKNAEVVEPQDGATYDLEPGAGAVLLTLKEETKTDRTRIADVPVAYVTGSGLRVGLWVQRAQYYTTLLAPSNQYFFQGVDGRMWTSQFFRGQYVLPLLELMRLEGEPSLRPYDGSPGNSLADKIYSMGSYRRGAATHVSRRRLGCLRKALEKEIYEHGRWRVKKGTEPMPVHYRGWPLRDRLAITQHCQ